MKKLNTIFYAVCLAIIFIISMYPQVQVDSLKQLLTKSDDKQKLKLLIKIGYFLSSENPTEAIVYLDEAISLADKTNNKWSKADAIFNKGVALWHLGEIDQSDEHYNQAIPIYEQFNDSLSLIKVFNSKAINNQMKGRIDLAFITFTKSLEIAKRIGDKTTILNTLLNIGIMYDNNSDNEKCLKYYFEALQYADDSDNASLALLQSYIAEVYLRIKNIPQAEIYLNKAIKNSKRSNDSKSLIWAYSTLGFIQMDKSNYSTAENYFKNSLKLARNTNFKLEVIHSLINLGRFYNKRNNYSEADKHLNEALNLAEELKSLTDLSAIYGELSKLYFNKQNFKKAYEYHQKYKTFSDSLFAISNNDKIAEIQTKYELGQKEREAELLKSENELQKKVIGSQKIIALIISLLAITFIVFVWILFRNRNKLLKANVLLRNKNEEIENNQKEISEKNEELAGLNATKDKFFSIIAHDLRNPIAAYVNISDLLQEDYDKLGEVDKKEIISQMNTSSKNLMRLLENLLTWARLSTKKIDVYSEKMLMKDIIEESIHPFMQSAQNKKIKININIPDDIFVNTDRFIVHSIVGNLINNAIKFSNSLSEITVSLFSRNGSSVLSVKDQGIGIEESQLRNIFFVDKVSSGKGTLGESGTGLGLVLVKELVEKLNWQIEVKSKENYGSEFLIKIPNEVITIS